MASLKVKVRRHDGTTEWVSVADAILVYERRLAAAKTEDERTHCEKRIAELKRRWKKALKEGTVERQTDTRSRRS